MVLTKDLLILKKVQKDGALNELNELGGVLIALQFLEIVCRSKNCFWDL